MHGQDYKLSNYTRCSNKADVYIEVNSIYIVLKLYPYLTNYDRGFWALNEFSVTPSLGILVSPHSFHIHTYCKSIFNKCFSIFCACFLAFCCSAESESVRIIDELVKVDKQISLSGQ